MEFVNQVHCQRTLLSGDINSEIDINAELDKVFLSSGIKDKRTFDNIVARERAKNDIDFDSDRLTSLSKD